MIAVPSHVLLLLDPSESALPVPGFGRYWITDAGRIISNVSAPLVMAPFKQSRGYLQVDLSRGPSREEGQAGHRVFYVHALVLLAFVGLRPCRPGVSVQIDHINGDKADNRLVNLEYVSASENMRRAMETNRHPAKLSGRAVWALRCRALTEGEDAAIAACQETYGVTRRTVRDALAGRKWGWVPEPTDRPTAAELARDLRLDPGEGARMLRLSPLAPAVLRLVPSQTPVSTRCAA